MFTAAIGIPPYRYVGRRRLESAMTMLAIGKLPLHEIAHRSCFSSQAGFTRAFRRATGMTPGEYRPPRPLGRLRNHRRRPTASAVKRTAGPGKTLIEAARIMPPQPELSRKLVLSGASQTSGKAPMNRIRNSPRCSSE